MSERQHDERRRDRIRGDWRTIVAVFWITSMIEGLGVSQVFALLPSQLSSMGVTGQERLTFIGLFSALLFVLGMPLVPLWGVWADKISRKAVIVRSALVEAVVFSGMALAREPWQVALSVLLIGFQLGNTGVMLAGIRDVTPRARIGTTIAIFGASGAVGFAVGPTLAGILIDGAHWSLSGVFWLSAALSVGTALLVGLGSREVRPEVIPVGLVLGLAFGAIRGVLGDRTVRAIFLIYGTAFLSNQMSRPYVPVLVELVPDRGVPLASGIALVSGTAALVGALLSPFAGAVGDRIGFRPVLVSALVAGAVAIGIMPFAGHVAGIAGLALVAVVFAACQGTVGAMVFSLLATEVPAERRSQTLNLVYLPLYAAGILGPFTGAIVVGLFGPPGPFLTAMVVYLVGAVLVARRKGAAGSRGTASQAPAEARRDVGSAADAID